MGYCTEDDVKDFFRLTPGFERAIVADGIVFIKYWLTCDQKEQEKRFQERLSNPLKQWKLSPVDMQARERYAAYTRARTDMLNATHTKEAPWTIVDFNDQRVGRLTLLRHLLDQVPHRRRRLVNAELVPLPGKLKREQFGKHRPIPSFAH
jgi:polyphosphate kinase 2 (PPK2 family)